MTTNTRILLAVTLLLAGSGCAAGASTQTTPASPAAVSQSVDLQFLDLPPQATQYLFTASKGPAWKQAAPPPAMRYPVSRASARAHLAAHPIAQ